MKFILAVLSIRHIVSTRIVNVNLLIILLLLDENIERSLLLINIDFKVHWHIRLELNSIF